MQEHNLFKIYIDKLNHLNLNYFVTGSVAVIMYGEPRLTHDIDIVIFIADIDICKFINEFSETEFYVPPVEVIKNEIKRGIRGHFNLIHHETGFKADIYPIGNDPLHMWAMKNRKEFKIENASTFIAPPEYVIIRKLEYYEEGDSDKHIRDIKSILQNYNSKIDFNFIRRHIKSEKSLKVLDELQKEIRSIR